MTHGWCEHCNKEKRLVVTTTHATLPGTHMRVPVGLCGPGLELRDSVRHELTVYVPAERVRGRLRVAVAGSAIVGPSSPDELGRVMVDYEGGIYDQDFDFDKKLFHAAGRHIGRYPTVARAWVPAEDLMAVGTYTVDGLWNVRLHITDQEALDAWTTQH